MTLALIAIFVLAYVAIAGEELLKVDKSAAALAGAGLLWTVYALGMGHPERVVAELDESLIETAQIAFFLMGAMTIVEIVDNHDGFDVITSRIRAKRLSGLIWVLSGVTFFLSADARQPDDHHRDDLARRASFWAISVTGCSWSGMIVIAANAGGSHGRRWETSPPPCCGLEAR